ncbi:ester cyclase [Goodfellowiella coeruleoviolacea]|uniref:Ester cyclase n=1 Tax=Goodfellowiella coeruleoviolacea TaxID=334858 RepID=A0AAE3GDC0_9PSEU|nr:ester cyclase [Goodfellowiella coeruleoviolacea]MCP2165315.1 putative ester cyclase [Goodfellowiella coeruleoviolacea]
MTSRIPTGRASDQVKQPVLDFFAAINARDLAALHDCVAPDVVDHNKMIYGEPDEPGAAFEGIRQQTVAFDPLRLRVDELLAEGDKVVARVTQSGRHVGTHPRMPEPTGREFSNAAIYVFTVADGVISEIRAVSDRLGMFLQLGWDWPAAD